MISGYEGIGFSAAQGGGQLNAFIDSQHIGVGKANREFDLPGGMSLAMRGRVTTKPDKQEVSQYSI